MSDVLRAIDSAAIEAITSSQSATEFTCSLHIFNGDDPNMDITPIYINKMKIQQIFVEDVADTITVNFDLLPVEYDKVVKSQKNLYVVLVFQYINPQTQQVLFYPAPYTLKYRAIVNRSKDLFKMHSTDELMSDVKYPKTERHTSMRIPISLQLIEEGIYLARQQQFNAIYQNETINNTLRYIAAAFGMTTVSIVPPDNTHIWEHLIIPPAKNIDNIFSFLQKRYGVYLKGCSSYYTNGTLYIYPDYENNPITNKIVHIYSVTKNGLAGVMSRHRIQDANTLEIVIDNVLDHIDPSVEASESVGTSVTFMRSNRIIDNNITMDDAGPVINKANSITVAPKNNNTLSGTGNNSRYKGSTSNIFEEYSKLSKWDTEVVKVLWNRAIPNVFIPGHGVKYHFDNKGEMVTRNGILESVEYDITMQRHTGEGTTYAGSAVLTFRIETEKTAASSES